MSVGQTNALHLQEVSEQEETHSPGDQAGTSKQNTDEKFDGEYDCYKIIYFTRMAVCT